MFWKYEAEPDMMLWWFDDMMIHGYKDTRILSNDLHGTSQGAQLAHTSADFLSLFLVVDCYIISEVGFLSGNVCYIFSRVYRQHFWVSMDSKGSSFYLGLYVFTTVLVWQIQFQIVKRQTAKHQPKLLPFIKQKKSTTKILISSQYKKLHGLVKKVC